MKILFICGCLESGKDGVGDYVEILSKELVLQQKEVAILALNDPYVSEEKEETRNNIAILRLKATSNWKSKVNRSRICINKMEPDHIIWQFVLYTYHPKGLPFKPVYLLTNLLKNYRNVSVMFHEVWIGAAKQDGYWKKCIGQIQRLIIYLMLRVLNPFKVFTSNFTYIKLLKNIGIESTLLPLFSNIPFVANGRHNFKNFLLEENIKIPKNALKIGHFGRIPFFWKKQIFFEQLRKIESPVVLFIAGRSDQMKATDFENEILIKMPFIQVVNLGEQKAQLISGFLQYIDLGLTLNAPQILDKSGVFAAFREHGLPAIIAGIDKHYSSSTSFNEPQDPLKVGLDDFYQKVKNIKRSLPKNTRIEISKEFIRALEGGEKSEPSILLEV